MAKPGGLSGVRSVRFRILTSMLLVAALGMAVAGGVAFLIQRERVLDQIDQRLTQSVEGLQFIADGGDASAPPTSVDEFLTRAMQRVLPDHNESILGLVNGEAAFAPSSGVGFRLDDDREFVQRVVAEADGENVVRGTAETSLGTLRYVIIPVGIENDPNRGLYVSAYNLDEELSEIAQGFSTYAAIAAIALVVVGFVGWVVSGRLLRPIRELQTTAEDISENDLSRRINVDGRDDVSELARTVNAMLDRLERSFESQRRLLDDVSHELRTPVTIVRGHLELLDPRKPDEVEATRELAIDELDRMNVLVGDIALLAKTNTPGFLRPQRTDVGELTEQVLAKANVLSTAHTWRVTAVARGGAELDPLRITQAWLQLAENAAKYAPEQTEIELGSSIIPSQGGPDTVELWVRDYGPGIPQEQLDWVFDRFARVQVGRGVDGSGLGLSIVAAIAEAHGGRAFAQNPLGGGARVVIAIPRTRAAEPRRDPESRAPAPSDEDTRPDTPRPAVVRPAAAAGAAPVVDPGDQREDVADAAHSGR
jgi:signal transduction histidine kinase